MGIGRNSYSDEQQVVNAKDDGTEEAYQRCGKYGFECFGGLCDKNIGYRPDDCSGDSEERCVHVLSSRFVGLKFEVMHTNLELQTSNQKLFERFQISHTRGDLFEGTGGFIFDEVMFYANFFSGLHGFSNANIASP